MNDYLIMYIKRNITYKIDNETIIFWFQNIKTYEKQMETLYIYVFIIIIIIIVVHI